MFALLYLDQAGKRVGGSFENERCLALPEWLIARRRTLQLREGRSATSLEPLLSSRRTVPQLADQLSKGADGPLHLRGAFAEVEAAKLGSPAA